MAALPRPRRSALYIPGSNARALDKGRSVAADVLILDLEDAVSVEAKEMARAAVAAAVNVHAYGKREVVVRVNGLETPWIARDIAAIVASHARRGADPENLEAGGRPPCPRRTPRRAGARTAWRSGR